MQSCDFKTTEYGLNLLSQLQECAKIYFEKVYDLYLDTKFDTKNTNIQIFSLELEQSLAKVNNIDIKEEVKGILNDSLLEFIKIFDSFYEHEIRSILNNYKFILMFKKALVSVENNWDTIFVYPNMNLIISVGEHLEQDYLMIRDNKLVFNTNMVENYVN